MRVIFALPLLSCGKRRCVTLSPGDQIAFHRPLVELQVSTGIWQIPIIFCDENRLPADDESRPFVCQLAIITTFVHLVSRWSIPAFEENFP